MIITTKLRPMELTARDVAQRVDVVQDDKYSRNIELPLLCNGEPWQIPNGATAVVRYKKRDGTGGNYDALPDGTPAYTISGNTLTVALAPQVCTVPGPVELAVGLISGSAEINTFVVNIIVQANPGVTYQSKDYIKLAGTVADTGWTPNMYLGTDADGNVVEAEPPLEQIEQNTAGISELKSDLVELSENTRNINTSAMGRYNNTAGGNIYPQDNTYYGMSDFEYIEPNAAYSISCGGLTSSSTIKLTVLIIDENGEVLSRTGYENDNNRAIQTPQNADRIHVFYHSDSEIIISDDAYCQIEKSESSTPYIRPISAIDAIARELLTNIQEEIAGKLGYIMQIPESTNIDTILDIGIYTSIYARISSYVNYPSLFSGLLIVFSTNTTKVQVIIDSTNQIYVRFFSNSWNEWVKYTNINEFNNVVEKIENLENTLNSVMADDGEGW